MQKEDCLIRILDDDQELLEALEFALTNKGWACKCYSDAETFFKELDPQQPGCLLLDIQMPQNGRVGSAKKTGKARQWPDDHFYEQLRDVGHGS